MATRRNAAKAPAKAAPNTETVKAEAKTAAAEVKAETPVKKADPKACVVIEFSGKQIVAKDVLDKAVKAYEADHKGAEIKTIEVYVKPEENVAYYVVNGEGSDDYKVIL